ncbi:hypothetical protein Scep_006160 [Stephania cephalantha]|uniref:Uncharacterized protein n=1 Tax=Stephania cephalantha TaxID=152367 RepID=A0AAP0K7H0_9MAGN
MVSVNPNYPSSEGAFFLDRPIGAMAAALPGMGSMPTAAAATAGVASAAAASDDLAKKTRKPYTITKSRESWTEQEHDKFLEALQLFDRDWKKIEAFVGSKTVIQIRSHAQKYFLKVQKNGTSEHVPPPRPKRKAAHPYPQKATKNAPLLSQVSGAFQTSSSLHETGYVIRADPPSMYRNSITSPPVSSWAHSSGPPVSVSHMPKDDMGSTGPTVVNNCCSSTESTPRMYPIRETIDQGNHGQPLRVMPDFSQVYSFIGSVFDPNSSGHLQKLQKMDPINVETLNCAFSGYCYAVVNIGSGYGVTLFTVLWSMSDGVAGQAMDINKGGWETECYSLVLLLMRNLSVNLSSPDFEDHRRLLSSYEIESDKAQPANTNNSCRTEDQKNIPIAVSLRGRPDKKLPEDVEVKTSLPCIIMNLPG